MGSEWKGIYVPIATPFKVDQSIDFDSMKYNLFQLARTPIGGIVILGSNGEFAYLSYQEKIEVVRLAISFWKEANPGGTKKIIVGTGCESTLETIKLTKEVSKLGAQAALIIPPCYYKVMIKI